MAIQPSAHVAQKKSPNSKLFGSTSKQYQLCVFYYFYIESSKKKISAKPPGEHLVLELRGRKTTLNSIKVYYSKD